MPYVPSVPYVDENIVSLVGGSVGAGTFTPGAWNVLNLNEDVINASWNKGMEQLHDFKDQMGALLDDTTGWLAVNAATPIVPGSISVVAAAEPAMTVSDTSPAQVYGDFNTQVTDVIDALSAKFAAFIASKFPNEQSTYDAAEAYLLDAINNPLPGGAVVGAPAMSINDTSTAEVYGDFDDETSDIIDALSLEFETFMSNKYPGEPVNYAAAEAYLLDATTNATSNAIPDAIKAKIIADGRTEVVATAARAFGEAITRYAAMRHPLPPGALASATMRIAQDAIDAETSIIRGVAIKDFELAYQKIKDAVSAILANRPTAFNSARDFISAAISQGYVEGGKIVATAHGAETAMINAATGFYNAQINDFQLAYAKLKDAFSAALANRSSALNATREYILATTGQGYIEGGKITATAHAAETAMLNAASGYFNARINAQELLLKADIADETLTNDAEKANQQAELEQIQDYLKGFLAQAQALAAIATALTNNIRAGANSSYNVSI